MHSAEFKQQAIATAQQMSVDAGGRLTPKRQRVLELLLEAKAPMSAYELTDAYNQTGTSHIMAMSVYRILEFLVSARLIHRLHSANKYTVCNHFLEQSEEGMPLFLICQHCHQVSEVSLPAFLRNSLAQHAALSGFQPAEAQLEMNGVCHQCQNKTTS